MASNGSLMTVLIACSSSPGMFDTELAVAIDTLDGAVSLFADRSLVEQAGLESALRTYAAADSLETDPVRVLLPSEAFETGSRWIRVASTKVRTT